MSGTALKPTIVVSSMHMSSEVLVGSPVLRPHDAVRMRGSSTGVRISRSSVGQAFAQSVGSIGSLLGGLLGIADDHTGTVELKGTVVLAKKNILDGQDQRGDWADTIADKRGRKVDIRLVSAELDPATKQPKVSAASSIQDFGYETKEIATGEDEINGYAENGFGQDARN